MTLLNYYPLNGNLDNYGTQTAATNNGATVASGGPIGQSSYDFDGSSYIEADSVPSLSSYTNIAWVNFDTIDPSSQKYDVVSRLWGNNDTLIGVHTGGPNSYNVGASHYYGGDNYVSGPDATTITGSWHHIAATWDGTTLKFYFDGDLVDETSVNGMGSNGNQDCIGGSSNSAHYSDSQIAEVRVYDRAMSHAEIKLLYTVAAGESVQTSGVKTL